LRSFLFNFLPVEDREIAPGFKGLLLPSIALRSCLLKVLSDEETDFAPTGFKFVLSAGDRFDFGVRPLLGAQSSEESEVVPGFTVLLSAGGRLALVFASLSIRRCSDLAIPANFPFGDSPALVADTAPGLGVVLLPVDLEDAALDFSLASFSRC